ncbi:MAG: histidine kinase [Herminiimonas sp.]|nr:histidine kinase [Herminiimonas sp.]
MHRAEQDIRKRLAVVRLPAMPEVLLQLIERCQNEEPDLADLASLIAKDPGMAAAILGIANSSAYRRSGRDIGIERSLHAMGADMVRTLVISESVYRIFNRFSPSGQTDLRSFWKHSMAAALSAREIAARIAYPHAEEAYLAGLLHDIGRLGLLAVSPREYALNFRAPDDAKLCWIEQRTLQITHCEAGAWLIERWQLDSFLADSVLYHHEPVARLNNAHALIRIILLAHLLADPGTDEAALAEAGALCGLGAGQLKDIRRQADEQTGEFAEQLGIDMSGADDPPVPVETAPVPAAERTQERLSEEIRNMVLASNAGRAFSKQQDESALLETIIRSARILFGFEDATILMRNRPGTALAGTVAGEQRQRLAEFSIVLAGGGAIADAARESQVAFIRREGELLGVGEEQLLNILGTECLVGLPLVVGGRALGVMVGGVASDQVAGLQQRERFLLAFGSQAGNALQAAMSGRADISSQVAAISEEYREASRQVAHEVNNPLSIIKNYLSILDGKLRKKEPVVSELSILNEEIDRVGQIISGLGEIQPAVRDGVTEVGRVVREIVRLFQDTEFVPPSVTIITRIQDPHAAIEGSPDILKQILVNLMKNAVEALPDGGEIEIIEDGQVNRDGRLYLDLSVRDNGPGITPEVLANLFSPVHSTKGGEHRGIGLSIVHGLVSKLHGMIMCRSGKKGTTFQILLPIPGQTVRAPGSLSQVMDTL